MSNIVAVAGQMRDGVRTILHRLRKPAAEPLRASLDRNLRPPGAASIRKFGSGSFDLGEAPLSDELAGCTLRIVQEGLTNISRMPARGHAEVAVRREGAICIVVSDDGVGIGAEPSRDAGSGRIDGNGEKVGCSAGR